MNPKYIVKLSDARLHISKGNSKLGKGIYSFSTLPGNKKNLIWIGNKTLLTEIPGTCSKHCNDCFNGGCYAVNSARLHHNAVIRAWAENTLLLRNGAGQLFAQIHEFIAKKNSKFYETGEDKYRRVRTWRWNVSGEIENLNQLIMMDKLAAQHPEVQFGIYTKNYEVLEEFMKRSNGAGTQPNFTINVSEWHGVASAFLAKYPGQFNVFEFDDSNRKESEFPEVQALHCPGVDKKGHHAKDINGNAITCDRCNRCYRKTGLRTAVWAH